MATFPGLSLLQNFNPIFTLIFVFVVIYALLEKTNIFGKDKKGLNSLTAFVIAFMFLLSESAINVISFVAPWFVVIALGLFFLFFIIMMFGVSDSNLTEFITGKDSKYSKTIIITLIMTAGLIFALGLGNEFGGDVGPYLGDDSSVSNGDSTNTNIDVNNIDIATGNTNTDDFQNNLGATIFHPKVLGMILLLLIGSFTIRLLAAKD